MRGNRTFSMRGNLSNHSRVHLESWFHHLLAADDLKEERKEEKFYAILATKIIVLQQRIWSELGAGTSCLKYSESMYTPYHRQEIWGLERFGSIASNEIRKTEIS